MAEFKEDPKPGIPAWLVSFGDMMTLILTFFILLVSLANTQQPNGMARGVGSFQARLKSHGLPGLLSGDERKQIFNEVRVRFNLPPEEDPERRALDLDSAASTELVDAKLLERVAPSIAVQVPGLVRFVGDSTALEAQARRALEGFVAALDLGPGTMVVFDIPHVPISGLTADEARWLAFERAEAVRMFVVGDLALPSHRVRARCRVQPRVVGESREVFVDAAVWEPHGD
ncbi:MAG: hypothetical protein IPJ77_06265 [Planctomycetes bacterium]|nr:hypothetical protein [Planctomycetota bacterium]